jgi:hypothetical protein
VSQLELPKRLWDINAEELESMGFDPESIRAHAMAELGQELYALKKIHLAASPDEIAAVECLIKDRHKSNWGVYSVQ